MLLSSNLLLRCSVILLLYLLVSQQALSQSPNIQWDQTLGGTARDLLYHVSATSDGGYLIGGKSESNASGNKTLSQQGYWVVKLNAAGIKQWERVHGNADGLNLTYMQPTADGGYLLGGSSATGVSTYKTQPSQGGADYWVVKIDANGVKQWDRAFGGSNTDYLHAIKQTPDGGYLLGGTSWSGISGDKSQASQGLSDYWVVRIDANGTKLWDRTFGGLQSDECQSLDYTLDGGCILGGFALSGRSGDKTEAIRGSYDYWAVKLDASGTKQWDRTYGGNITDVLTQIYHTADGGYILGGFSESDQSGDRTQRKRGGSDYWIVKLNAQGAKEWDSSFGSTGQDELRTMQPTADGGYLLGGDSAGGISDEKSQPSRGFQDYWVVKTDGRGRKQWDRTLGTASADQLTSVIQAPDGSYLLGGFSDGNVSVDRTQPSLGNIDFWPVKLGSVQSNASPRAEIRGDSLLCSTSLLLTATSSIPVATYLWNTGATTRSILVAQPGLYTVTVTFPNNQTATDQQIVSGFNSSVRITGDSVLCANASSRLAAVAPGASSYFWSTGDSTAAITIRQPGTYSVTAYYEVSCSATTQIVVRQPTVSINGSAQLCSGSTSLLTAIAPGATRLQWNTGTTSTSLSINQPGTYTVVATFPNGCTASATQTVTLSPTTLRLAGDSTLCAAGTVTLSAIATGATGYTWNTGATTPTISVAQAGTYSVVAVFSGGCTNRAQIIVRPAPTVPAFSLGADTTLCENQELVLRAPVITGAGVSYVWSDNSKGPTLTVRQPGVYSLRIITPCSNELVGRRILAGTCSPPPNIITPNGDLLNERWVLQGLPSGNYSVEIYNRWGRKVYETPAYHNEWGPGAIPDTYYYLLRHTSSGKLYKGWLTVAK